VAESRTASGPREASLVISKPVAMRNAKKEKRSQSVNLDMHGGENINPEKKNWVRPGGASSSRAS